MLKSAEILSFRHTFSLDRGAEADRKPLKRHDVNDDDDDNNAKNDSRKSEALFALLLLPPATSRGGGVPPSVFFFGSSQHETHRINYSGDPFRARESEPTSIERHDMVRFTFCAAKIGRCAKT